jgi:hypothetical protein
MPLSLLIIFACILWNAALPEAKFDNTQNADWMPGYIARHLPLSAFADASLKGACDDLAAGSPAAALPIFSAYSRAHPSDEASFVGYLQSLDHLDFSDLANYENVARQTGSSSAQFRLGAFAFYYLERPPYQALDYQDGLRCTNDAASGLGASFKNGHPLLAGFLYSWISAPGGNRAVLEVMLRDLGGQKVFDQYEHAKASGWNAPIPAVPTLRSNEMIIFAGIVQALYVSNGSVRGIETNNVWRPAPYTPEQKHAMDYLWTWVTNIRQKAGAQ